MRRELVHGGNIYERTDVLLDFSANINPLGMPEGVKKAVTEALSKAVHYPDPLCRKLCQALSTEYQLPAEYFICGNGGADLIYRLVYALRPKKALLTIPTFAEYEEALKQTNTECIFHKSWEDYKVPYDILERMNSSIDVMFLCNPNNPTGLLIPPNLLVRILAKAEKLGIYLMVDECFLDFTGQEQRSLVSYVEECPHLFLLKSFTKMYAMPGIRLGYGISQNQELLGRMEAAGQCWGVSVLASEAGIAALREKEYKQQAIQLVEQEREYLKEELQAVGMKVWDGQADYLFFTTPGIEHLRERLLPYGILIRDCSNYRGLDKCCYRIAVKDHESNICLVKALQEAVK